MHKPGVIFQNPRTRVRAHEGSPGMAYNFKSVDRETAYLLPPNMREWLPAKHLAWFIVDTVESLDLRKFYLGYRNDGWGRAAYEPKMMTALFLYAYCLGEQSSREIEKACEVDVAFRVVAGNERPDHTTICRFRSQHEDALKGLFLEVLRLCRECGLVKAGAISLDGTKMKANAALSANRDYEHLKKEVDRLFEEAKAKDAEEDDRYGKDRRGDEMPDEMATKEGRLKLLQEAKARLEADAAAQAAKQAAKIAQRQAGEAAAGKKKRGRALYKLRGQTVEPTFGQIKDGRGCDGFSRRGVKAADSEWSLLCTTHNLLKLWRSGKARIGRILGRMSAGAPTFAPVYA